MGWPLYQPRRAAQRRWIRLSIVVILAAIGLGLIVWALVVPVTLAPPLLPDDEPSSEVTVVPSGPASSAPTPTVSAEIRNPRGNPVKITITSAAKGVLVRAKVRAIYIQPDGRLVPPPGVVGWMADTGWPKPGVLSRYNSIVAGHISGGGQPDVFYRLPDVRKGDEVVIKYDSEDRVVIRITKNPVNIGKSAVTSDPKYDWVWQNPNDKGRRVISFFTCNAESEHIGGHSVDNWVTQGEVEQVIKA